jgi:plasmid maintenance system killer protein
LTFALFGRLTLSAPRYRIEPRSKSFGNEGTRLIYSLRRWRKLLSDIQQVALRKLRMIGNATSLSDLRIPPTNHLFLVREIRPYAMAAA